MPRANAKSQSEPRGRRAGARAATRKRTRRSVEETLQLTADRLVVRAPDNGERKSAGGLLIPATAVPAPKRLQWGDVSLVGPDVRVARAGDRVLFLPQAALEVELDGQELLLLRERDVQAVQAAGADSEHATGQYL